MARPRRLPVCLLLPLALAVAGCGEVTSSSDGGSNADAPIGSADSGTPDASGPAITSFVFREADNPALSGDVSGTIVGTQITVTVPPIDITALVPTITHTGTSVAPDSGTPVDFTSPATYTVDGQVTYTVTVELEVAGLWWNADNRLYWASADGSRSATVVTGLQFSHGVAVDTVNGFLYYSDYDGGTITRAKLNGASPVTVVTGSSPAGIALDTTNNKMYWADFSANAIMRANLDGTGAEQLNTNAINSPINLALDVANNRLFFITYNNTRIGVMPMAGGADTNLLNPGGQGIGIGIDVDANKMYFSTRGGEIGRADLDGRNLNANFISGETGVHGLALDIPNNKIYWATTSMLRSGNLSDGGNKQDITPTVYTYVPGLIFVP